MSLSNSEPFTKKLGHQIKVGDIISVWWGDKLKINRLEKYSEEDIETLGEEGQMAYFKGTSNNVMINDSEEVIVYNELKESSRRFFKCKGEELKVGDIIDVQWKADGDEITKLSPYIGMLAYDAGAQEAKFKSRSDTIIIDNSKTFSVFYRFGETEDKEIDGAELEREIFSAMEEDYSSVYSDMHQDFPTSISVKGISVKPIPKPKKIEVTFFEA